MRARALAAVAVLLTACTHTYDYRQARFLDGDRVTVETVSGESVRATAATQPGEPVFVADGSGQVFTTSDIRAVSRRNRPRGALEGVLIGLLVGGGGGAAIGSMSGDDHCREEWLCIAFTAQEKAVMLGLFLGLIGGVTGAVVGGVSGATERYELRPSSWEPAVSLRADHRGAGAALTWTF